MVAHITKAISEAGVNIAFMRLFRDAKGGIAYTIVESDDKLPAGIQDRIRENPNVHDGRTGLRREERWISSQLPSF